MSDNVTKEFYKLQSESSMPLGFVCARRDCTGWECQGPHYNYYSQNSAGRVPILIDGSTNYIAPQGLNIYYRRQAHQMTTHANNITRIRDEIDNYINPLNQSASKRRKLNP